MQIWLRVKISFSEFVDWVDGLNQCVKLETKGEKLESEKEKRDLSLPEPLLNLSIHKSYRNFFQDENPAEDTVSGT